jgi:branched-chain amino acid transport system substrate-binding protein
MMTIGMPNDLLQVLQLAAVLLFATTTVAAVLSSIVIRKDDLLYLGSQLVFLSFFLYAASPWAYPLWFSEVFAGQAQYGRAVLTVLFLALGFTLDFAMKVIVWRGIIRHSGRAAVPPLLVGAVRVLIYLFAALFIIQFVYGQSITALATLSGAFAIILGLSAQTTLGEMFAGIAIALSRPFHIGDWVKIGQLDEGRVVDATWRMVRIETRDKNIINVPNRMAADAPIRNFTHPNRAVRITDTIHFARRDETRAVQKLLVDAIAAAEGVLRDPKPSALYRGAKRGVAEYSMRYYIDDYADRDAVTENVWRSVLERVAASDFTVTFEQTTIELRAEPPLPR